MVSLTTSAWKNGPASEAANPRKPDIGEIDTNTPFQSVKAAVSLFRGIGSPKTSPISKKCNAEERVLEKETHHQMMTRELGYYKDQLRIAQMGKSQALHDLQRANHTFQELTNKLENLSISRQASIRCSINSMQQQLEETVQINKSLKRKMNESGPLSVLDSIKFSRLDCCQDFVLVLNYCLRSVRCFVKLMIREMEAANWDIKAAAKAIQPDAVFIKRDHRDFAFESFVCRVIFSGFNDPEFSVEKIEQNSQNQITIN